MTEPDVTEPEAADSGNGNSAGNNGQGNGNSAANGDGNGSINKTSTVVKQFVVDYNTETFEHLMEHEVNGLDYKYVYGNDRLSVDISPINNSMSIVENGDHIRLYYHMDYLGTADYLTSPVSLKVESWTHYNEWGEIVHNAVLNCGQRELDLVKRYATHDYDSVLELYYAKARFYDADNRRFTAMDPILDPSQHDIREYVDDPMQYGAYQYVLNAPLTHIDLLGFIQIRYENIVAKREAERDIYIAQLANPTEAEKLAAAAIVHPYSEEITNLQTWLEALGFADSLSPKGTDFGGKTQAAFYLFEFNYGLSMTEDYVNNTSYLSLYNLYLLNVRNDLSMEEKRQAYNLETERIKTLDKSMGEKHTYYRQFACEMNQRTDYSAFLKQFNSDIEIVKDGNIYYMDYTSWINETLSAEESYFANEIGRYHRNDSLINQVQALKMFYDQVTHGAKWDIKLEENWNLVFNGTKTKDFILNSNIPYYAQQFPFYYNGIRMTSEDLGNVTYGYMGTAVGYSLNTLINAAVIAGDDVDGGKDKDMVKYGYDLYHSTH